VDLRFCGGRLSLFIGEGIRAAAIGALALYELLLISA
jgi:hypothetical protein